MKSSINFRQEIERRVAKSGVDLPDATIDELVAYLEDLHAAALDEGAPARRSPARARWPRSKNPHFRCCSATRRSIPIVVQAARADLLARSRRWKEPERVERDQAGAAPVPSASDLRARHGAGARPRHRRGDHGVHGCRFRGAAAAALRGARSARDAVGHQSREGARARSDLAGELHGLPRAAGVHRRGRLVAAGRQPRRSRHGSDARQHHRGRAATCSRCSA